MLRRDDVDRLVGVHIRIAGLCQLTGHAGADDLGAVQAEDRVHNGRRLVLSHQLGGGSACLRQAELCQGDTNVVVDMAVAGGIVPLADAQLQIRFAGGQFYKIHRHGGLPLNALTVYGTIVQICVSKYKERIAQNPALIFGQFFFEIDQTALLWYNKPTIYSGEVCGYGLQIGGNQRRHAGCAAAGPDPSDPDRRRYDPGRTLHFADPRHRPAHDGPRTGTAQHRGCQAHPAILGRCRAAGQ